MYIRQKQLDNLKALVKPGKVLVIYGARRTGKTTLIKEFLRGETHPYLLVNPKFQRQFKGYPLLKLKSI
ncbi:MAG: hypothetical protein HQM09_22130 [Candidatus Riflebacteria bacterium]|nr:hypothetical protein [Candidatus Riflebacteria bacterium]